jgi:hypothetical protein
VKPPERPLSDTCDSDAPVQERPIAFWSHGVSDGQPLEVDLEAAARHLRFLDPHEPRHTYQVAPDVDGAPRRVYHGPLAAVARHLIRANEAGAGVYVMANAGDLLGRKRENVTRVRFGFVDLDGGPLPEPDDHEAHAIIWTSPGKAHLYWRVDGVPVELFRPMQLGLARTFSGDESVVDPPRVLRLAGFLHRKREPFLVTAWWLDHDAPAYSLDELRRRFPLVDVEIRHAQEAARRKAEQARAPRPTPSPATAATFPEKLLEVVERKAAGIMSTGRHELLTWTARTCLDNGLSRGEAERLTLQARDRLPARDRGPVPDDEVVDVVAWAYANLQPGEPWREPTPATTAASAIIPPRLAARPATRTAT